jgi:hypothetical protein
VQTHVVKNWPQIRKIDRIFSACSRIVDWRPLRRLWHHRHLGVHAVVRPQTGANTIKNDNNNF